MNKNIEKMMCSSCGENKHVTEFYASSSPFYYHMGRISVCNGCFCEFIRDDIEKLKTALRTIDKPFLTDILQNSQEEATRTNKNLIKLYMKNLSMPQYKNLTWKDSNTVSDKKEMSFDDFRLKALQKLMKQFLSIPDTKDTVLTRKNIIEMIKDLKQLGLN